MAINIVQFSGIFKVSFILTETSNLARLGQLQELHMTLDQEMNTIPILTGYSSLEMKIYPSTGINSKVLQIIATVRKNNESSKIKCICCYDGECFSGSLPVTFLWTDSAPTIPNIFINFDEVMILEATFSPNILYEMTAVVRLVVGV